MAIIGRICLKNIRITVVFAGFLGGVARQVFHIKTARIGILFCLEGELGLLFSTQRGNV